MDRADQPTEADIRHQVLHRGVGLHHRRLVVEGHREASGELDQEADQRDAAEAIEDVDVRGHVLGRDVIDDGLDLQTFVEPVENGVLGVGCGRRRVRHAALGLGLRESTDRPDPPVSEPAPSPSPAQPFATGARRRLAGLLCLLAVFGLSLIHI